MTMSRPNSRITRPTPSQFRIKRAMLSSILCHPKEERREFPNPPLICPRHNHDAPWHSCKVWSGNLLWLMTSYNRISGWSLIRQNPMAIRVFDCRTANDPTSAQDKRKSSERVYRFEISRGYRLVTFPSLRQLDNCAVLPQSRERGGD